MKAFSCWKIVFRHEGSLKIHDPIVDAVYRRRRRRFRSDTKSVNFLGIIMSDVALIELDVKLISGRD